HPVTDPLGLFAGLCVDLVEEFFVGVPRGEQSCARQDEGVFPDPSLGLGLVPVAGGIVGGRMRLHPVGERLDHGGALSTSRTLGGLGGGVMDGPDVVAVDEDAGHAVPLCTCCDGSAGDLVFVGYR